MSAFNETLINSATNIAPGKALKVSNVQIPGTIDNIHRLPSMLKNTGEKVVSSVDLVNTSLIETASTVQENMEDILSCVRIDSEGLRIFLELPSKR